MRREKGVLEASATKSQNMQEYIWMRNNGQNECTVHLHTYTPRDN